MEGEVIRVEQILDRTDDEAFENLPASEWEAPLGLGPVPDELCRRAALLLDRQLAAAEALVERITKSKQHRDVATRMRQAPRPAAAFLDQPL